MARDKGFSVGPCEVTWPVFRLGFGVAEDANVPDTATHSSEQALGWGKRGEKTVEESRE